MQDEDYMRQLSLGIDSALDTLVFRYHKSLYGYAYRLLQDEKLAEDMVQETFLKIYQQGKKGCVPDQFKPWLYKIATNSCKDYWRKASTQREHVSAQSAPEQGDVRPIIDRQLERKWMIDLLNQLSFEYRSVLYLRFYQDLKYAEIALILELPINTVKGRIARGLKYLEGILKEEGAGGL